MVCNCGVPNNKLPAQCVKIQVVIELVSQLPQVTEADDYVNLDTIVHQKQQGGAYIVLHLPVMKSYLGSCKLGSVPYKVCVATQEGERLFMYYYQQLLTFQGPGTLLPGLNRIFSNGTTYSAKSYILAHSSSLSSVVIIKSQQVWNTRIRL